MTKRRPTSEDDTLDADADAPSGATDGGPDAGADAGPDAGAAADLDGSPTAERDAATDTGNGTGTAGTPATGTPSTGTPSTGTPATGTPSTGDGEPEEDARSWGKVAIAVAVVLAVVLGGFRIISLTSERDDLAQQVAALDESLRQARGNLGGQIEQLEEDNALLAEQTVQLQTLFTEAVTDLDESLATIEQLNEQLEARAAEIEELTAQIAELQAVVDITGTDITLMPDLLGTPIEDVRELALEQGFELVELEVAPGNVIARPGDVIEQLPLEDTPLLPGSVIWVEVFTPPIENGQG